MRGILIVPDRNLVVFLAALMAFKAAPGNVDDAFFSVVFLGFRWVVAGVAVDCWFGSIVAGIAVSAGVAVLHWERMSVDVHVIPVATCFMAVRTLSVPMFSWWCVARLAVFQAIMAEVGAFPAVRCVAARALTAEMVGRPIAGVARLAVCLAAVIETRPLPAIGGVAV